jgi:hypothetical protein
VTITEASEASKPSQRFLVVLILDLLHKLNWANNVYVMPARAFGVATQERVMLAANSCGPFQRSAIKSRPICRWCRGADDLASLQAAAEDDGCSI